MKIFENLDLKDLENEIWKNILDYENNYQISNSGRIKSLKFGKEKILKQIKDNYNYFFINLCKNGKSKIKYIHHLVYETFKGKLEEGYDAHHINENKEDNFVGNLESKPHNEHSSFHNKNKIVSEETKKKISKSGKGRAVTEETRIKIKGKNNPNYKITNQKIIDIRIDIEKKLSQRKIANKYDVSQTTVSSIKTGKVRELYE